MSLDSRPGKNIQVGVSELDSSIKNIAHLLAWIVESDPLSQGHQCSQKFGLSLVLKIFDERYFLDVDHSLGLEGI